MTTKFFAAQADADPRAIKGAGQLFSSLCYQSRSRPRNAHQRGALWSAARAQAMVVCAQATCDASPAFSVQVAEMNCLHSERLAGLRVLHRGNPAAQLLCDLITNMPTLG